MVANGCRGEVSLRLGDREYVLRPTFARLVALEAEIGSLFALVERAAAGDVRVAEMAATFWHCVEACEEPRAAFEGRLLSVGVSALLAPYRTLLARLFAGS